MNSVRIQATVSTHSFLCVITLIAGFPQVLPLHSNAGHTPFSDAGTASLSTYFCSMGEK